MVNLKKEFLKELAGGRNLLFPQAYSRADLDKNPKLLIPKIRLIHKQNTSSIPST